MTRAPSSPEENALPATIQIPLSTKRCPHGEAYGRKHLTAPPKIAVLSCEGACLRGEVARRAAGLLAREVDPGRFVRICHGGLLETGGGMRELLGHADRVLVLDGCGIGCGDRLLRAAMPEANGTQIVTDRLFDFDRKLFAQEEMSEAEIAEHARSVASQVARQAGVARRP